MPKINLIIIALALFAGGAVRAETIEIGPAEATALFAVVRGTETAEQPVALEAEVNVPVILTLYGNGAPIQRTSSARTLRDSTKEASQAILSLLDKVPNGRERFDTARLGLDIVTLREPLASGQPPEKPTTLRPGIDGLAFVMEKKTVYLPPLLLLRNWHEMDVAGAAYASLESLPLSANAKVERIETTSFIEASPGEAALALYRGNVLVSDVSADQITQSIFRAGLWLLRTQGENGEFMPAWTPGAADVQPADPILDQLRALFAIGILEQLSDDEVFRDAGSKALRNFMESDRLITKTEDRLMYVVGDHDDVTGTALLLTALCQRAMIEGAPAADRRMAMLGDFLAAMTEADGRMHPRFADKANGKDVRITRGLPYAESLIALALLQRISPSPKRAAAADKIADILAEPPADVLARETLRESARSVEALVEYYKLTRSERHAEAALKLAETFSGMQASGEKFADYAGGFAEKDAAPATGTTSAITTAIASAYELKLLMRRPTDHCHETIHNAAVFLINMQYRRENSFFLPEKSPAHGAFRENPGNLSVRLGDLSDAIRALVGATVVTAETAPAAAAVPAQ